MGDKEGGSLSPTVTVNEHFCPEVVVKVTLVEPSRKNEPDVGVKVGVPHSGISFNEGKLTIAPSLPGSTFTIILEGQVRVQFCAWLFTRVIVNSTSKAIVLEGLMVVGFSGYEIMQLENNEG